MTPILQVTAMTHRGAVRASNEDALVIGPLTVCAGQMADPVTVQLPLTKPVLVAVADGLGGHAGGEVASARAAQALAGHPVAGAAELEAALRTVDAELLALSAQEPELAGLGTTVAGIIVGGGAPGLRFSVGDSRIYLERGGYLAQLSRDDRSAIAGGLTQCLGGRADGAPLQPRIDPLDNLADARVLLCSDGLSDLVDVDELENHLADPGGAPRSVKAMWAAAMNASGRDNITIALLAVADSRHDV